MSLHPITTSAMTVLAIAQVCHEINRAYCQSMGDDSQPSWEDAPADIKMSEVNGVIFHQQHPDAGPEASHNNWLLGKEADGWVYGKTKNMKTKRHPCMVDFSELPDEQKAKDYLFRQTVHSLSNMSSQVALCYTDDPR